MWHSSPLIHVMSLILTPSYFVAAQTSTATWYYPPGGLTVNYIDTVVFEWTSNYDAAWLKLWCQDGAAVGNEVHLASQTQVSPSGNFSYILSADDTAQETYPVACHAQLAQANGDGVDSPNGGINFSSQANVKAQTFSLSSSTSSTPVLTTSSAKSTSSFPSTSSTLITTISSSGSTATPASSSSSFATSSASIPTASGSVSSTGGRSSGFKAGIGIGLAIAGIVVLGVCIWLLMRRKKKVAVKSQVVELADNMDPAALKYQKFELEDEARRRHELAANPAAHELGDDRYRAYELP